MDATAATALRRPGPRVLVAWALALWGLVFCLVVAIGSRELLSDSFLNLYAGRYIAAHGIPGTDPFTLAGAHRRWIDQQWLAHLAYYQAWKVGGYALVGALSAALVSSAFGLLAALLAWLGTPPLRVIVWTLFALIVCMLNSVVRAQSFAYPLFVGGLWLLLVDGRRARRLRWLALPPMVALWANLHGSVVVFAAVVWIFQLVRAARARRPGELLLAVACTLAALVTPYGLAIVGYYASVLHNPVIATYVTEWFPASFGNLVDIPYLMLLVATLFVLGFAWGRRTPPRLELTLATIALGIGGALALRSQIWFAFAAVVLVSEVLNQNPAPVAQRPAWLPGSVLAGTIAALVFAAVAGGVFALVDTGRAGFEREIDHRYVDALVATARGIPDARLLTDERTGPRLLWTHPELQGRIAFDGRYEVYRPSDLRRWLQFLTTTTRASEQTLRDQRIDVVAISNATYYGDRRREFGTLAGYRQTYTGPGGVIAVRR